MKREAVSEGGKWEPIVGYSRAVRVGPHIYVAGTTATDEDGKVVGVGDPYQQALYIFKKIGTALRKAGADLKDVVCTRMYVTDIQMWQEVGRAHHDVFAEIRPAATLLEISALVLPEMLVEIEVQAINPETSVDGERS
jgi:enamine deaminase RidA (YjgF/YER057c/UK114 family)